MALQPETIRIRTTASSVAITLRDGGGGVFFDASSPTSIRDALPERLAALQALGGDEELVFSFEFDASDPTAPLRRHLRKLDAHVRSLTVTEHDDGLELHGDLTAWVGYTHS